MYSDENKSSVLAKFMNPFDYVIIDTCSLMDEAFPEWMDVLHNAKEYRKKEQAIYVPHRCYDELKKHAKQTKDDSKRIDAKRGLKIIRHDQWFTHMLTITKKDKAENFADNAIYVKVGADRLFSRILIITQDKFLASDLRALNSLKSQSGRPLEVCKIIAGGRLVPNLGEPKSKRESKGHYVPVKDLMAPQYKAEGTSEKDILAADQRLSAVLNNGNYPEERKRQDVQTQIKALEKLTVAERNALPLVLSLPSLRRYLVTGSAKEEKSAKSAEKMLRKDAKPASIENPSPVTKQAESAKKIEEEAKKEAPTNAAAKPVVADRLWYGAGKTFRDAVIDCASHYGIIFRDPSIAYSAKAHGPFDWTMGDYEAIIAAGLDAMKDDLKMPFTYQGVPMWSQKASEERYKCWIDINAKQDLPSPKETEAPNPQPKPKAKPKKAKPKVEAVEPAPAEEPKQEAPKAKKPAKAKANASPKEEAPKAEKPAAKPKTTKAKKPAPKKEEKPAEPTSNTESAEKIAPEAAKPAPKKKAAKKPTAKKADKESEPVPSSESPNLKKAMDADRRLRAVLPNSNYPLESKIADLKAQRELLNTLTEAEFSKLKYGPKEIDEWLKSNGGNL